MAEYQPSDYDLFLFHQGRNYRSYRMLGAHLHIHQGVEGVRFVLWAPNAKRVSVTGDFNSWQGANNPMEKVNDQGIWIAFVPGIGPGALYKYEIVTQEEQVLLKADPYGFYSQLRPDTASVVYDLSKYKWQDKKWMQKKQTGASYNQPMLIYEVHLGSWKQKNYTQFLTYGELAEQLVDYVSEMGYTHIELLPVSEHPYDGSWGYQATGYYAATSRYGEPAELMLLIDKCHQRNIGVILDWVPGHFCRDAHGLRYFDGCNLYESDNPQLSENYQWDTVNFDYGRSEIACFLISNVLFWLDLYHIDGIRVDAVANMLYLDYCKECGQWTPNKYGGNENLEAVELLKTMNHIVFDNYPSALMIAEESTTWPLVTKPTYLGGLGFNYKWNMGWMNDMLRYMEMDPIHRKWHHNLVTFSFMYAFSENFILPLSHDEVVHGKKSLLNKMPGDYWQKFANLRLFLGYMIAHPGKKLIFMGGEFGQFIEWRHEGSLDWHLLEYPLHQKMHHYTRQLNHFYGQESALWQEDFDWRGFQWIDPNNYSQSIISFLRRGTDPQDCLVIICNFTPQVYQQYKVGVPELAAYAEIFNSDWEEFGGSGQKNYDLVQSVAEAWHNQPYSVQVTIPPLATVFFRLIINNQENNQEND